MSTVRQKKDQSLDRNVPRCARLTLHEFVIVLEESSGTVELPVLEVVEPADVNVREETPRSDAETRTLPS